MHPIRAHRHSLKQTQIQYAEMLGIPQRSLSDYEHGTIPGRDVLLKFKAAGVSVEDIVLWGGSANLRISDP